MRDKSKFGVTLAIGVAIGTAIGVATDNLGLWLSLGVAIGAGLGAANSGRNKSDQNDFDKTDVEPDDKDI